MLGLVRGLRGTAAPRERSVSDRDFSKLGIAREPTNVSASGVLTLRSLEQAGEEGAGGEHCGLERTLLKKLCYRSRDARVSPAPRRAVAAPKLLHTAQANPA